MTGKEINTPKSHHMTLIKENVKYKYFNQNKVHESKHNTKTKQILKQTQNTIIQSQLIKSSLMWSLTMWREWRWKEILILKVGHENLIEHIDIVLNTM